MPRTSRRTISREPPALLALFSIYGADANIANVFNIFVPTVQVAQRKGLLRQFNLLKAKALEVIDPRMAGQITLGGLVSHRIADEFFTNINADQIVDSELRAVFSQAKVLAAEGKEIPASLAASITDRVRRFAFMMIAGGGYRTQGQLRDIEGVIAGLSESLSAEGELRETALNIPLRVLVSSMEDEYLHHLRTEVLPSAKEGYVAKEILTAAADKQRSQQNIYPADLGRIIKDLE